MIPGVVLVYALNQDIDGLVVALSNDRAWSTAAANDKVELESVPPTQRCPVFAYGFRDRPVNIEVV